MGILDKEGVSQIFSEMSGNPLVGSRQIRGPVGTVVRIACDKVRETTFDQIFGHFLCMPAEAPQKRLACDLNKASALDPGSDFVNVLQ